jgi:hypothetical protein
MEKKVMEMIEEVKSILVEDDFSDFLLEALSYIVTYEMIFSLLVTVCGEETILTVLNVSRLIVGFLIMNLVLSETLWEKRSALGVSIAAGMTTILHFPTSVEEALQIVYIGAACVLTYFASEANREKIKRILKKKGR